MNPLKQSRDVNPDHCTPDGDRVAATITIRVFASGAMSVGGDIGDLPWALAALDCAKDAIKSNHARKHGGIILPAKDVGPL